MGKVITPNVVAWKLRESECGVKLAAAVPGGDMDIVALEMAAFVLDVPVNEAAESIEMENHLLLAWAINGAGEYATVHAWYLPMKGPKWVYSSSYYRYIGRWLDGGRRSAYKAYKWFEECPSRYRYFKVCAPFGLLLGNKALREEYLAGKLAMG